MYILRFPLHLNQIISWQIGSNSVFFRTTKRPQSPIKCQPARQTLTRPKYILTMACNNFIDCSRTASSCFPPSTIHQPLQLMNSLRSVSQTFSTHRQQKPFPLCCYCLPVCLSVLPSVRIRYVVGLHPYTNSPTPWPPPRVSKIPQKPGNEQLFCRSSSLLEISWFQYIIRSKWNISRSAPLQEIKQTPSRSCSTAGI